MHKPDQNCPKCQGTGISDSHRYQASNGSFTTGVPCECTKTEYGEKMLKGCPICGELVDLSDEEVAVAHMQKDDAHIKRVTEIMTEQLPDVAVNSGIMRRVCRS